MEAFFEHRLWLNRLKLGLKIRYSLSATIGMAPSVCECVIIVMDFVARPTPKYTVSESFSLVSRLG